MPEALTAQVGVIGTTVTGATITAELPLVVDGGGGVDVSGDGVEDGVEDGVVGLVD